MVAIQNLAVASMLVDFARDAQLRPAQMRGPETALAAAAQASAHRRRETPAVKTGKGTADGDPLAGVGAMQNLAASLTGGALKKEIAQEMFAGPDQSRKSEESGASRRADSAAAGEEHRAASGANLTPELFAQTFARPPDGVSFD